jgi:hypothetical protein
MTGNSGKGGLGKFDISLKQCVRDDLPGLLRFIDARLELVEVLEPELHLAELRRDKLLVVRLFEQKMALNVEFQTDADPTLPERLHSYACQVYVLHKLPTFGVVIHLRPRKEEPTSRFVWAVNQHPLWQYEFVSLLLTDYSAEEALATGSPFVAVLSPLMQHASLETVKEAARIIWGSERDLEVKDRFLTGLAVFAGELAGLELIQQTIAQAIMEHDILQEFKGYKSIIEKGLKEGMREGMQEGMREGMREGQAAMLRHQFERRLGRPLSEGERDALGSKIEMLGSDAVGDAVLDTPEPERLLAWLMGS